VRPNINRWVLISVIGLGISIIRVSGQQTGDEPAEGASVATVQSDGTESGILKPLTPGTVSAGSDQVQILAPGRAPSDDSSSGTDLPPTGDDEGQSAGDESVEYTPATGSDAPKSQDVFWRIVPYLGMSAIYDDNIGISNTSPQSDIILSPALGLSGEVGDYLQKQGNYLTLQAIGTELVYLQHPQLDALNQLVSLNGQYSLSNLATNLASEYQYLTTPDRDVGGVAKRAVINNDLTFTYPLSSKTALQCDLLQDDYIYFQYLSSYNYAAKVAAIYQLTSKITVGVDGGAGFLVAQESPLQTYQQSDLLFSYQATDKLTFKASGGLQAREFDGAQKGRLDPVFLLEGQYQPFPDTTLDLQGYDRVQASAGLPGTDYTALGFQFTATQTLFQKVNVSASIGAEHNRYFAVSSSDSTDRVDNYLFLSPQISVTLLKHYQVSVIYEFRRNQSNQSVDSYFDNRAGIQFATDF